MGYSWYKYIEIQLNKEIDNLEKRISKGEKGLDYKLKSARERQKENYDKLKEYE